MTSASFLGLATYDIHNTSSVILYQLRSTPLVAHADQLQRLRLGCFVLIRLRIVQFPLAHQIFGTATVTKARSVLIFGRPHGTATRIGLPEDGVFLCRPDVGFDNPTLATMRFHLGCFHQVAFNGLCIDENSLQHPPNSTGAWTSGC